MDSKFSALIAYIIFCLKNGFDDTNEVMVLDNLVVFMIRKMKNIKS